MALDQQSLTSVLTQSMSDAPTSWIVFGPFELGHIVARLLTEVPQLSSSTPDDQGFAQNPDGTYRWICIDAELGSAAFIFPRDQKFDVEMRDTLNALDGSGLEVTVGIYGNVDDRLWSALGAGHRKVVAAQDFLPLAK